MKYVRILINDKNVITAILYAVNIDGSIEIKGDIPAEVTPLKWCYTAERGFYENPNYTPPEPEDPITQDDYNMDFDFRLSCLELGL